MPHANSASAATRPDAFAVRGIVEGFYGIPWTHTQRLDFLTFMAARGMNTYVYSPKHDSLLRERWREPYSTADITPLAELVSHARAHGLRVVYCLSPGLTMQYSEPAEIATICNKFDAVAALGIRDFGVFFDDIPRQLQHPADRRSFGGTAEAHAHVINAVFRHLHTRNSSLIVCPTAYWGHDDVDYLPYFGRAVDPRVDVFWTGRAICSPRIDLAEVASIARTLNRPVTLWDNYPVNDVAMWGELHVGPYLGRDRHLYRFTRGVIANVMERAESSKIAVATIADYLVAPESYEPETSWHRAIMDVAGLYAEAYQVFADNVRTSCLADGDATELADAFERVAFAEATSSNRRAGAHILRSAAQRLERAVLQLEAAPKDHALLSEAEPWLEQFRRGTTTLSMLAQTWISGIQPPERAEFEQRRAMLRTNPYRVFGSVLDMALEHALGGPTRSTAP